MKCKILKQEEIDLSWDDGFQSLAPLGGCGDYGEEQGLGEYTYYFQVEVTNQQNETRTFDVYFQTEERTNQLRNYNGYELAPATVYGLDDDQSNEIIDFCDGDDSIIDELEDIAESQAKKTLEALTL